MGRRKVDREELKGRKKTQVAKNEIKKEKNKEEKKKKVYKEEVNLAIEEGIQILNNQKEKEKNDRNQRIENNKKNNVTNEEYKDEGYEINKPILFFVIAVILLIIYLFFEIGPIFGISLNKQIDLKDMESIDIITTSEDVYKEYMSELLIYSNHKVCTYNKNSNKTWEYSLAEQFTPNIYIKDKYLAIANNSTGNIYLFEDKKEILNIRVEGEISNIYFDDKGNFAVDYSTNEYKKVISVYNKKGTLLYNTYPSAKAIINLSLLEDASKLLVTEVTSDSFKIGIDIYIIDSNSSDNSVQKIASLDNCFAYDLTIVKDDIIILLDNEIISCNMNTGNINKIKTFDSNQMLFVGLSKNYYFSIEKELNDTDLYKFTTRLLDDEQIGVVELGLAPKQVKSNGIINYIVYQNNIEVINKWGINVKDIIIESNPKQIIPFGSKTVALIYTNKVYIVNL